MLTQRQLLKRRYGDGVVGIFSTKEADPAVQRWRETTEGENGTWCMVGGFGHLASSKDLVQGHRMVLLEPNPSNSQVKQAPGRLRRAGQFAKECEVVTLLHEGSMVEESLHRGNQVKDDIERGVKSTKPTAG